MIGLNMGGTFDRKREGRQLKWLYTVYIYIEMCMAAYVL